MAILDLKQKYNNVLATQNKAIEWFESDDFQEKFKAHGAKFFDRAYERWEQTERNRIELLIALEALEANVTIHNIIYGFDID